MRFFLNNYRRLITHPRYGIWVVLATLLYLISPIDLAPDIFPILGQIDDVALIVLMLSASSQWVGQLLNAGQTTSSTTDQDAASQQDQSAPPTIDVKAVEVTSDQ